MFKNLYEAPQELATGGYVTRELHSVTIHFDDIHYSLSSGQLNGGYHHTLAVRNQQLTYQIETEKDLPGGSVADYLAQEFEHIDTPVHFSTALLTSATMHLVGRYGNEMFGYGTFIACMIQEPFTRGQGVGQGFLGGKGFGSNDEQRGFRVDFRQYVAQLGAVHVGDEVHIQARMTERLERGTHHQRAEVGATDTDVDDVGNHLIGIA